MTAHKTYYFGFPLTHKLKDSYFSIKANTKKDAIEQARRVTLAAISIMESSRFSYGLKEMTIAKVRRETTV